MKLFWGAVVFGSSIAITAGIRKFINERFDIYYVGITGWLKHVFTTWAVCYMLLSAMFSSLIT